MISIYCKNTHSNWEVFDFLTYLINEKTASCKEHKCWFIKWVLESKMKKKTNKQTISLYSNVNNSCYWKFVSVNNELSNRL